MQYHVDFNSFEEYKNGLKKQVDNFRNELDIVRKLEDHLNWEGEAKTTALDLFGDKLYDLYTIPQILDLYIKFMDIALTDYQDGMEEIKKSFDEVLSMIKTEKQKRGEVVNEI